MAEENKRVFQRTDVLGDALLIDKESEKLLGDGKLLDVSIGGARIETARVCQVGDTYLLDFSFVYPNRSDHESEQKISAKGTVETRWKAISEDLYIYGFQFVELSDTEREKIGEFVSFLSS